MSESPPLQQNTSSTLLRKMTFLFFARIGQAGRCGSSRAAAAAKACRPAGWTRYRRARGNVQSRSAEQCPSGELPPELQGLYVNEDGLLMDEKTGEVVNEYGATRFDVAVRALRGEFDPPASVENTERSQGLLLESLMQFPNEYVFNIVLKAQGASSQELAAEMAALVARVCQADVPPERCSVKERKGGKYVSLEIPAVVRASEIVHQVFAELEQDQRVFMKY